MKQKKDIPMKFSIKTFYKKEKKTKFLFSLNSPSK